MTTDTQNSYPELFGTYIIARAKHLLGRVQQDDFVRSTSAQQQLMHTLQYALQWSDAWPDTRDLLLASAPLMEQAGYREEWGQYLKQGIAQSQQVDDNEATAELYYQIGVLWRLQSKFAEARHWLAIGTKRYAILNHTYGQAKSLNQLAYVAYLQHDYDEAAALTHRAINMLEPEHHLCAMSYAIRGKMDIDHGRWQEAEMWHRRALEIRQASGDQRRVAWSLLDLTHALCRLERFAEAIDYYQQAIAILDTLGDVYHWSHAQLNLGLVYFYTGEIKKALTHYTLAEVEWRKHKDLLNLAKLYTNCGLAYLAINNATDAEHSFQMSIHLYEQLVDDQERLNAIDGLAMALLEQNKFSAAADILEQGLAELPRIASAPTYNYLLQSMTQHLEEAQQKRTTDMAT